MKTGIEWLAEMAYQHQVLFLKRLSETRASESVDRAKYADQIWPIADYLNKEHDSLYHFILRSFNWEATPEGHDYWKQLAESALVP